MRLLQSYPRSRDSSVFSGVVWPFIEEESPSFIPEEKTRTTERRWFIPTCAKDILGKKKKIISYFFPTSKYHKIDQKEKERKKRRVGKNRKGRRKKEKYYMLYIWFISERISHLFAYRDIQNLLYWFESSSGNAYSKYPGTEISVCLNCRGSISERWYFASQFYILQ